MSIDCKSEFPLSNVGKNSWYQDWSTETSVHVSKLAIGSLKVEKCWIVIVTIFDNKMHIKLFAPIYASYAQFTLFFLITLIRLFFQTMPTYYAYDSCRYRTIIMLEHSLPNLLIENTYLSYIRINDGTGPIITQK